MFCRGFGPIGYGSSGFIGGGFIFMGIRILIFAALIILGVKLYKNHMNGSNNSIKILTDKFARGEITEEEYLKRKSILSQRS